MDLLQSLILALAFTGVLLALLTKYFKSGLLLTLISFIAYFILIGLNTWFPLFLFILALSLIVLEVFIPDFGIVGIAGIIIFIVGLYMATDDWMVVIQDLSIALIITALITLLLIKNGRISNRWERFVLKNASPREELKTTEDPKVKQRLEIGQIGQTLTPLRPSGYASFELSDGQNIEVDVTTEIEALEKGQKIRIENIQGQKIIVRSV